MSTPSQAPMPSSLSPLVLEPRYVEKVWGGHRLQPRAEPVGEAWVVYEKNVVRDGEHRGRTLDEVARTLGPRLLGDAVEGLRFPLLIKLIDASESLSVQVHPNDAQAAKLEGTGQLGKTEAWHILAADPGAELVIGLKDGVTRAQLEAAMGSPQVKELLRHVRVHAGDTLFVPAGTVHAIGPGLLLYEVQQTSDITYRVYDWDRPMKAGRELHIQQSLEVADLALRGEPVPAPKSGNGVLTQCPFFKLEMLSTGPGGAALTQETGGVSFHALTVIDGRARLRAGEWSGELGKYETAVVPAAAGRYTLEAVGGAGVKLLKSSVR